MADILENPVDLIDDAYEQEIQVEQEPIEVVAYRSYNQLDDKPQINGVELVGNKTSSDLGITEQINSAVDSEAQTRQQADSTLQGKIDAEETARKAADKDIQDVLDGETLARQNADTALGGRIDTEIHDRQVADIGLQGQIDAITSKSDVVDVVADYAALQAYDTQHLGDNDVIKVLDDETHGDALTYYRWSKTNQTWSYIGQEAPYYSKSQTDTLFLGKQDKIDSAHKLSADLVDDANSTNKFVTAEDKTNWDAKQNALTAGTGIEIENGVISTPAIVPEVVAELPATGAEGKLYLTPKAYAEHSTSGNPAGISIEEGAGAIDSITIGGDTFQQSYDGKNLLNAVPYANPIQQGVEVTITNTNTIHIEGTSAQTYVNLTDIFSTNLPAGTYTMSINKELPFRVNLRTILSGGGSPDRSIQAGETSVTFTTSETTTGMRIFMATGGAGIAFDKTFTVQLVSGNAADYDFEPYVGGQPSPNPDYPQTVQSVTGQQTVTVASVNLFDKSTIVSGYLNASGDILANPDWYYSDYIPVIPGESYTISGFSVDAIAPHECFYDANKSFVSSIAHKRGTTTIVVPDGCYYIRLNLFYRLSTGDDEPSRCQFEKGTTATFYTDYYRKSYQIDLGDIQLRKLRYAYGDRIYYDDGWKLRTVINKKVINGSETTIDRTGANVFRFTQLLNNSADKAVVGYGLCDHFIYNSVQTNVTGTITVGEFAIQNGDHPFFKISTLIDTVADCRAWFAEHNTAIYYPLVNARTTEIADTNLIAQLEAIRSDRLGRGNFTIEIDSNGSLSATYHSYNPEDQYDEWIYTEDSYEKIPLSPVDGGYEFYNSANADSIMWKIWNARLAHGTTTDTAIVPSYFNSTVVANGMVIAHNTGSKDNNRWGLHIFEGYSKDDYGRLTMLLDKFTENNKKSSAIYYFDGNDEYAPSYKNVKVGSDCVGHSFNFDRDEMTAYGAVFCNLPFTLARINPSTDLITTYDTVAKADAAYHPEGSMVNNVKCLKYIYLKNAPDGTMWYDTARNKIVVKINGEWHDMNTTAVPEGTYDF